MFLKKKKKIGGRNEKEYGDKKEKDGGGIVTNQWKILG